MKKLFLILIASMFFPLFASDGKYYFEIFVVKINDAEYIGKLFENIDTDFDAGEILFLRNLFREKSTEFIKSGIDHIDLSDFLVEQGVRPSEAKMYVSLLENRGNWLDVFAHKYNDDMCIILYIEDESLDIEPSDPRKR